MTATTRWRLFSGTIIISLWIIVSSRLLVVLLEGTEFSTTAPNNNDEEGQKDRGQHVWLLEKSGLAKTRTTKMMNEDSRICLFLWRYMPRDGRCISDDLLDLRILRMIEG